MQVSKIETSILKNICSENFEKLPGKHAWWDNIIWCLFIYSFIYFFFFVDECYSRHNE